MALHNPVAGLKAEDGRLPAPIQGLQNPLAHIQGLALDPAPDQGPTPGLSPGKTNGGGN